ncbi:MAG TPA: acyltransferase [Candidatus Phocaeicola gallistercoris]|nr:acyltransferase [Candidatus Phocaeicola gallistercoris]
MDNTINRQSERIVWLDVVRIVAMLMVIGVHCIDPFYISPAMRDIPEYTQWAANYGSFFRPSVPLFAMMTGLLLLPVKQTMTDFYKKRILRVLFPIIIWSVFYNLFPWFTGLLGLPKEVIGDFFCYTQGSESQALEDALKDVAMIPFQFSFKENHMWYMYLLIGLYLYMPFFSAWIEKATNKEKRIYLGIWFVSLFLPYMNAYIAPLFGVNYLFGEATWNAYGLFYYFAGFNGYLMLGHFLKKGNDWGIGKTISICVILFIIGYYITWAGFSSAAADSTSTEEEMELFFTFCSPNVAIMTAAVFLLLQKIRINNQVIVRFLARTTKYGFGIYIVHYFIVGPFFLLIGPSSIPIPLQVPLMSICIFAVGWLFVACMYKIFGKNAVYIVG